MLERESGHINDRYRLWETVELEDGREECVACQYQFNVPELTCLHQVPPQNYKGQG